MLRTLPAGWTSTPAPRCHPTAESRLFDVRCKSISSMKVSRRGLPFCRTVSARTSDDCPREELSSSCSPISLVGLLEKQNKTIQEQRELQPLENKVLFQKTTTTKPQHLHLHPFSSSHSRFITMVHLRNTLQPIYSPPPKRNKSKLEEEVARLLAENPTVSYLRITIQGKSECRLKRFLLSVFAPRCHLTAESRLFDVRCQRFAPR